MLDTRKMLSEVNGEITRLGKIRDLLMMENGTEAGIRPLAARTVPKSAGQLPPPKKKRQLSEAGREAIAAAVRKRWAAARKQGVGVNGVPLNAATKKKAAAKAKAEKAAKKAAKAAKSQAASAV